MLFVVPILTIVLGILFYNGMKNAEDSTVHFVYSSLTAGTVVFALFGYWIMCIVWAYRAVKRYNENLQDEYDALIRKQKKESEKIANENKNSDTNLLTQLEQLTSLKEKGVLNDEEFNLKATEIKNKLVAIKNDTPVNPILNAVNRTTTYNNYETNNSSLYIALTILFLVIGIEVFYYFKSQNKNQVEIESVEQVNTLESNTTTFIVLGFSFLTRCTSLKNS
jgi:cbb3-type cytochrome oxidase subunit 3